MLQEETVGKNCLKLLKRLLENGPLVSRKEASEYAECLKLLSKEGGAVEVNRGVKVLPEGFLMLIKHVLESGVSLESVLKSVNWRGFERIIAEVFRVKGFRVMEHFRFSLKKTVREIDVLVATEDQLHVIEVTTRGYEELKNKLEKLGTISMKLNADETILITTKENCEKLKTSNYDIGCFSFENLHAYVQNLTKKALKTTVTL